MKIITKIKQNKSLIVALFIVFILTLLPVLNAVFSGYNWKGVIPIYLYSDFHYYHARMKEIKDGNIFIGNPFFLEHNKELAPAFFVADWIAAIPLLIGFSMNFTIIFDFIFWSLVLTLLIYILLRQFSLSKNFCLSGTVLAYIGVYSLMFRPVSMQTIMPFFVLFLLALTIWFKRPFDKKTTFFLVLATTLSFYIYTYLSQIILVLIFLLLVYLYFVKKKREALNLIVVTLICVFLSSPIIFYTIKQLLHPYYWETMERIGLVHTHLPAMNIFYLGIRIFLMSALWYLSFLWVKECKASLDYKKAFIIFVISGVAMVITSASNIITGKELENSQHVERFATLWLILSFVCYLFFLIKGRIYFKNIILARRLVISILLLFSLLSLTKYFRWELASLPIPQKSESLQNMIIQIQAYARPLEWLENNESEPKVIWTSSEDLDTSIPVLTKHYSLWGSSGYLHLVSSDEVKERYLVFHYFNDLKQTEIEKDFWGFAGVGNAVHQYKVHNRQVKICRILHLDYFEYNCGETVADAVAFRGHEYFENLYKKYMNEIKPNINQELDKFHVTYLIKDLQERSNFQPEQLGKVKLVYQDDRFLIYQRVNF